MLVLRSNLVSRIFIENMKCEKDKRPLLNCCLRHLRLSVTLHLLDAGYIISLRLIWSFYVCETVKKNIPNFSTDLVFVIL